jgi:arabinosaccharide transport system substrate-binding protein
MLERFPYGKAPYWLTLVALSCTLLLISVHHRADARKADLVFAFFAPNHVAAYQRITPAFEKAHHVHIALQLVHERVFQTRLRNAMLAKTEVPDMVELLEGTLGFFTRGPLEDVGFLDLTDRLEREHYRERLVTSRLSLWSSRGHVFAIPHDVHPVMLVYRADLVEALGIDVRKLETWDDFVAAGRRVVADLDGDGSIDRYMLDLPATGTWGLETLLRQRGVGLFDEKGRVTFNRELTVDTIVWYLHQSFGPERIAFDCGWGQTLSKAISDGLALFYFAPDWRSFLIQNEVPQLAGKMKLMPMPAWSHGGRRTSVWGGTGLAIAQASPHRELAWEFAKYLYFNPKELGRRFLGTNIISPFKDAWTLPEFRQPNPYYSNQPIGELYAELARETPAVWQTPYTFVAQSQLDRAFVRAAAHFKAHGDEGLRELIAEELSRAEAYVQRMVDRNVLAQH